MVTAGEKNVSVNHATPLFHWQPGLVTLDSFADAVEGYIPGQWPGASGLAGLGLVSTLGLRLGAPTESTQSKGTQLALAHPGTCPGQPPAAQHHRPAATDARPFSGPGVCLPRRSSSGSYSSHHPNMKPGW